MEKSFEMTDEIMQLINQYAVEPLKAEDVYCFSLTLCDNEIDRDYERFSENSLNKLADLFVGKTGIFDHDCKSAAQTARIFQTSVYVDPSRLTVDGQPYTSLTAKAYMVRTASNADLIKEISGGIKKEVSVSCAVSKRICSICAADKALSECSHTKGKRYSEKLCYVTLEEPTDAYEWSFVAVPAQVGAGVSKRFADKRADQRLVNKLKSDLGDVNKKLSAAAEYVKGEILKLSYFCTPFYTTQDICKMTESMDIYRLLELRKKLEGYVKSHSDDLENAEKSFITQLTDQHDQDETNQNYTI